MKRFELWHPAVPYVITQGFGIYNPAYKQFGFTRHNGIDCLIGKDKKLYAPCELSISFIGNQPEGAGIHIFAATREPFLFDDGKVAYVEITFMHLETVLVNVGDLVSAGDVLAVPDNTGFSTGPHTHIRCRRIDIDGRHLDINDVNDSFDHAPYFNGIEAPVAKEAQEIIIKEKNLIEMLIDYLKGRNLF